MSDFIVKIEYKNEKLETVIEKEYSFLDYTAMLDREMRKILNDIEDSFFYFQSYNPKAQWSDEAKKRFESIRHKMLDQANAIKRLPQNLTCDGKRADQISIGEYINRNPGIEYKIIK